MEVNKQHVEISSRIGRKLAKCLICVQLFEMTQKPTSKDELNTAIQEIIDGLEELHDPKFSKSTEYKEMCTFADELGEKPEDFVQYIEALLIEMKSEFEQQLNTISSGTQPKETKQ